MADWTVAGRRWVLPTVLIAPSLLVVLGVMVYPIVLVGWTSLFRATPILPTRPFVGLQNYLALAHDAEFWRAMERTLYFVVASLVVETTVGLAIALVLHADFVGRRWVRAVALLPWAVPTIVNGAMWSWIYNPNYGALNGLLRQLGLIQHPVSWLGAPWLAMNMVIVADAWRETPFYVILFLTALQTIPREMYEASEVDGAGPAQTFFALTLPLLRPTVLLILIVRTIETFRVFGIIYVLTRGGPANGTMVVGYLAYQQTFSFLNFGQGAALAVIITVSIVILTAFYLRMITAPVDA